MTGVFLVKKKKNRQSKKAEIRKDKRRIRYISTIITAAILAIILLFSGYHIYSSLHSSSNPNDSQTSLNKAAIIDHLSLSCPNKTFVQTATDILEQSGYTVDYYPSKRVTVEFYRSLPTHGYKLIILRVHSALNEKNEPPLALFTSDTFSEMKYVSALLDDRLKLVSFLPRKPDDPKYYGIPPKFVHLNMKGRFQETIVIAMGCDGLTHTYMAEAFIYRGAKTYISWKGIVTSSRTDHATIQLLRCLVIEKLTIKKAVTETMEEVGRDPVDNNQLLYYPKESGDCALRA